MGNYTLKIMVMGDGKVGKSSLITRYVNNRFDKDHKMTIGINFLRKDLPCLETPKCTENTVKLQLWDLGGQERWAFIRPNYYKGANGGLLVYDITRRESYENLPMWNEEFRDNAGDFPIILIGNKVDLESERVVSRQEGEGWARENNMDFIETSAKDGRNVNYSFTRVAQRYISTIEGDR
jgi:small GTP-binding protein